jgi:hypothetical protein
VFAKELHVTQTWDGKPALPSEEAHLFMCVDHKALHVRVQAAFHNDAPPQAPPGFVQELWEYELVEVFLLGRAGHYLEIELGPHGHYLVYYLSGVRQVERLVTPVQVHCAIQGDRWLGEIVIDLDDLPEGLSHVNGYALHGQGAGRRYLAANPVGGAAPDFHQPQDFLVLEDLMDWSPSEG